MPRTVEHIVGIHRLVDERRKQGLSIWQYTLDISDVFHNERLTFEQRRNCIVRRIERSSWYQSEIEERDGLLYELVDELASSENGDEFDAVWDAIYDEADYLRVWIKTI
jgi:hypothetical protein